MDVSEAHYACRRNGLFTHRNTLLEQEIAPVLVRLETELAAKDAEIVTLRVELETLRAEVRAYVASMKTLEPTT